MDDDHNKKPGNSGPNFDLFFKFARLALFAGTYQMAILCAALLISPGNTNSAVVMAIFQPFSALFFTRGLGYMLTLYFFPQNLKGDDTFAQTVSVLIYVALVVCGVITRKRVVFFLMYALFLILTFVNIQGCVVMPKPGGP